MKFASMGLATVGVFFLSIYASASTYKLTQVGTIRPTTTHIRDKVTAPYRLDQNVTFVHTETELKTNSSRLESNSKRNNGVSQNVRGKDIPGFDYLWFKKEGEKFFLVQKSEGIIQLAGVDPMILTENAKVEVEFIEGSWDDYLAGKDVILKATSEGQKEFLKAMSSSLQRTIDSTVKALIAKAAPSETIMSMNVETKKIAFETGHILPTIHYQMNLKQIRTTFVAFYYTVAAQADTKEL